MGELMRLMVGVAVVVLAVWLLGRGDSNAEPTAPSTTVTVAYGSLLVGDDPALTIPGGPTAVSGAPPPDTPPTAGLDVSVEDTLSSPEPGSASPAPEAETPTGGDEAEYVGDGHRAGFVVSSNLPGAAEAYPWQAEEVAYLAAERLREQLECCANFAPLGAAVLFDGVVSGLEPVGTAMVILEWSATDRGAGVALGGSTPSRWVWSDGRWAEELQVTETRRG